MAYWSINYIAVEIEMPYGDDLNDLPVTSLQRDFNQSLITLIDRRAHTVPSFDFDPEIHHKCVRRILHMDQPLVTQFEAAEATEHYANLSKPLIFKPEQNHAARQALQGRNKNSKERHAQTPSELPLFDSVCVTGSRV